MTAHPKPRRQRPGRLTHPTTSPAELACDYALGPFDRAVQAADRRWGVDRLPELVSQETATRYGQAMAGLNAALETGDPAKVAHWAAACVRGLHFMDAEAEANGAPQSDPEVWEYEMDGFRFAVIRDDRDWPALKEQRPELLFFTMREVACALKAYNLDSVHFAQFKKAMPGAQVTKITPRAPFDEAAGGDALPEWEGEE